MGTTASRSTGSRSASSPSSTPEQQVLPQLETARDLSEGPRVDDRRPLLREVPLRRVGLIRVQRLGDDEAQHGVAEELLALVVRNAAVLVRERTVGQGTTKQRLVDVHTRNLREDPDEVADGPLRHVSS